MIDIRSEQVISFAGIRSCVADRWDARTCRTGILYYS